jgi:hypothetical protein
MEKKQFTEEEILGKIDASFDKVENLRREGLERIKLFHSVKNKALKKEKERLSAKLGADHLRVKRVAARLQYNQGLFKDLNVEIEKAKIRVPSFDKDSWMVHGRVLDKDKKGVSGLTVGLFDEKGNWVKKLGYGCTDKRGYFYIIYPKNGEEKKEGKEVPESMELFLYVSNKDYKILYKNSEPLFVKIGQVDYREIYLTDEEVCPTPEPVKREVPPKKEDIGRVRLEELKEIGPQLSEKLRKAGIKNIEAFLEADEARLKKILVNVDVRKMKKEASSLLKKKKDKS